LPKKQYDDERHLFLCKIWAKRLDTLWNEQELAESAANVWKLRASTSRLLEIASTNTLAKRSRFPLGIWVLQ
jgi:hypothetical protein